MDRIVAAQEGRIAFSSTKGTMTLKFHGLPKHVLLFVLLLGVVNRGWADATVAQQISDLTLRIEGTPLDARLYVRRGDLFRRLGEDARALADFEKARQLDPDLAEIDWALARFHVSRGHYEAARRAIDRFVAAEPASIGGRLLRARIAKAQGEFLRAADDVGWVIASYTPPRTPAPELYIERARLLDMAGGRSATEALEVLDAGIERLGPIVTLLSCAVDLSVAQGDLPRAIRYLDRAVATASRKAPWWIRQGEILERMGRSDAANERFRAARDELERLPPHRRRTKNILRLLRAAEAGIRRTSPSVPAEEADRHPERKTTPPQENESIEEKPARSDPSQHEAP
ncbi:MAG: tetratricopeptide repeat protein [Deltaproteobacteria bacterium]|nr:MAG: tetratricopeptide repeat protein [Deltaproteobacteria bacterium]